MPDLHRRDKADTGFIPNVLGDKSSAARTISFSDNYYSSSVVYAF